MKSVYQCVHSPYVAPAKGVKSQDFLRLLFQKCCSLIYNFMAPPRLYNLMDMRLAVDVSSGHVKLKCLNENKLCSYGSSLKTSGDILEAICHELETSPDLKVMLQQLESELMQPGCNLRRETTNEHHQDEFARLSDRELRNKLCEFTDDEVNRLTEKQESLEGINLSTTQLNRLQLYRKKLQYQVTTEKEVQDIKDVNDKLTYKIYSNDGLQQYRALLNQINLRNRHDKLEALIQDNTQGLGEISEAQLNTLNQELNDIADKLLSCEDYLALDAECNDFQDKGINDTQLRTLQEEQSALICKVLPFDKQKEIELEIKSLSLEALLTVESGGKMTESDVDELQLCRQKRSDHFFLQQEHDNRAKVRDERTQSITELVHKAMNRSIRKDDRISRMKHVVTATVIGAGIGLVAGTFFGVIGALPGLLAGGSIGFVSSLISNFAIPAFVGRKTKDYEGYTMPRYPAIDYEGLDAYRKPVQNLEAERSNNAFDMDMKSRPVQLENGVLVGQILSLETSGIQKRSLIIDAHGSEDKSRLVQNGDTPISFMAPSGHVSTGLLPRYIRQIKNAAGLAQVCDMRKGTNAHFEAHKMMPMNYLSGGFPVSTVEGYKQLMQQQDIRKHGAIDMLVMNPNLKSSVSLQQLKTAIEKHDAGRRRPYENILLASCRGPAGSRPDDARIYNFNLAQPQPSLDPCFQKEGM